MSVTDFVPAERQTAMISEQAGDGRTHWAVWLLIAVFFAVTFWVSTGYARYHADEWYYTDGAIRMVETGDYLTPRHRDNTFCFSKPPQTAWLVLLGHALFGVSVWSSRLPFVLVSCAVIYLTFHFARILFRRADVALLAAAMMAASHDFADLAGASITDCLFTFGMLLSHYGFVRILFAKDTRMSAYACAYIGAGVAVGTRLLGITPIFYAACFALVLMRDGAALWRLINVPMMLAGALIGVGWIVPALCMPSKQFVAELFWDQASSRFHDSVWYYNLWYYPLAILFQFAIWELPLLGFIVTARSALAAQLRRHPLQFLYLLGWTGMVIAMYVAGNITRGRYLMPAFPIVATLLSALLLGAADAVRLERVWKILGAVVAAVALPAAVVLWNLGGTLDVRVAQGGALIAASVVLFCVLLWRSRIPAAVLLACLAVLVSGLVDVYVRGWAREFPEPQIAALLQREAPPGAEVVVVTDKMHDAARKIAARLRVCTGARMQFTVIEQSKMKTKTPAFAVYRKTDEVNPDVSGYKLTEVARLYRESDRRGLSDKELFDAWKKGRLQACIAARTASWFVAVRQQP